jgi:predicted metal-dependent hydrolase
LVQVPKGLIDYAVMQELCHLKEHHHGAAFYALLGRAMPDWQKWCTFSVLPLTPDT